MIILDKVLSADDHNNFFKCCQRTTMMILKCCQRTTMMILSKCCQRTTIMILMKCCQRTTIIFSNKVLSAEDHNDFE